MDLLQFFEELPYYILLIAIFGLSIFIFLTKEGNMLTYKYQVGGPGPRVRTGTNNDGTPIFDDDKIIGRHIGGVHIGVGEERTIQTNIQMFYLFIWSIYMLIISLFKYLFEGIIWLIYALFQKDKKVASQGNINKDILDNEITKHATAIYTIIYIFIFNILHLFKIRLTWFIGTPDYVETHT